MTDDFKKGLATGIAIGGVTINQGNVYTTELTTFKIVSNVACVHKFNIIGEIVNKLDVQQYSVC